MNNIDSKNLTLFLEKTLSLAKKGRGYVSPNPEVGCVIVQNGEIIGRGFHEKFGENHAEVNAILDAENSGFSVEGSSVFVSLEPCSHASSHKKTPPCTNLLIQKKVSRVYILHQDSNPEVSGKGAKKLQEAGIEVFFASEHFPEIFEKHRNFYEKFAYWIQQKHIHKTPYVTLKLAQDTQNFLGIKDEKTKISGAVCREFTLKERDTHQAILVGANTVLVDNPILSGEKTHPLRIILDSRNTFTIHSTQNSTQNSSKNISKKYQDLHVFRDKNFLVISGKRSVSEILSFLGEKNISSVFVEGGGKTAQKFLESKLVQKYIQYTCQKNLSQEAKKHSKNLVKGVEISEFPEMNLSHQFFLGEDEVNIYKNTLL